MAIETKQTHGPQAAYYSNLPGPEQDAVIDCLCGWTAAGRSWEEVGQYFDEHISDTKDQQP